MPKGGGKRAKREPVKAEEAEVEAPEAAPEEEEFPIHSQDGCAVPLVCRDASEYYSVMGVLFWSHYNSLEAGIMRFFDTKEACVLREVHSEFRDAVSATPWHDLRTIIKGSVASWRECFGLRVQAASVYGRKDLVDADFVHFRGLTALDMSRSAGYSDAAYVNLRGISSLRGGILKSLESILHLKGVQGIHISCSDALQCVANEHFQGARSIDVRYMLAECDLLTIALLHADVLEVRRLLANRSFGSASWLYAGILFNDVAPNPLLSYRVAVIAAAGLELLKVGIDVRSKDIMFNAMVAILLVQCAWKRYSGAGLATETITALETALRAFDDAKTYVF